MLPAATAGTTFAVLERGRAALELVVGRYEMDAVRQMGDFGIGETGEGQMWAPTILIMGLYNKLVKLEGSE